jgi:hypothetical protein
VKQRYWIKICVLAIVAVNNTACFGLRSRELSADRYTGSPVQIPDGQHKFMAVVGTLRETYQVDVILESNLSFQELEALDVTIAMNEKRSERETTQLYQLLNGLAASLEASGFRSYWSQQYQRRMTVTILRITDPAWPEGSSLK